MRQLTSWCLVPIVLTNRTPAQEKEDKVKLARTYIKTIEQVLAVYQLKYGHYPAKLKTLVEGPRPYFAKPEAILDPWGKPWEYNPAGKRNKGKKPDLWTVTPDKQLISNWPPDIIWIWGF
jgi:hypothetical protein